MDHKIDPLKRWAIQRIAERSVNIAHPYFWLLKEEDELIISAKTD